MIRQGQVKAMTYVIMIMMISTTVNFIISIQGKDMLTSGTETTINSLAEDTIKGPLSTANAQIKLTKNETTGSTTSSIIYNLFDTIVNVPLFIAKLLSLIFWIISTSIFGPMTMATNLANIIGSGIPSTLIIIGGTLFNILYWIKVINLLLIGRASN